MNQKWLRGEKVKVNIEFGERLGAYTFDIAYDNNIFEYVSSEGGTENDNGSRVRVTYYDSTGGTNPRTNMSVTFKAKEDLITTNPTDFSITAEGLANSDASQSYDDIVSPIKKSITVEPKYVDYKISFKSPSKIIIEKENKMELITESSLGKSFDHVKMKVDITNKPSSNAVVKLLATERTRQTIDLVQDGWGGIDGYELGGKNVKQILDVIGIFSEKGQYTIKISLLDKDSSDAVITSREFNFNVEEDKIMNDETNNNDNQGSTSEENKNEITREPTNKNEVENNEKLPDNLPKTGMTQYVYILTAIAILGTSYIVVRNVKK